MSFLKDLREEIISAFLQYESSSPKAAQFVRTAWAYDKGHGGGEMSVLRNGALFEKAAVNWSGVGGDKFPMDDASGAFFATGVSLITHMANPKLPTVHFNIRYIETEKKSWFGGGYDLTPMGFPVAEDTEHFHRTARSALDVFDPALYPKWSQAAKEYFYIPHRQKERGVGGIFFDHYSSGPNSDDFARDYALWQSVGKSFLPAVLPLYDKHRSDPFSPEDRQTQLKYRAHYAEFNLLYDRGTKFGFQSGGNPEAILCSMPPLAAW